MISIVDCKFNNKMLQFDCCFVLGCWVQCHVLCQKWCCACWSWWNTKSYATCCCTGDTQLGSVNFTSAKFKKSFFKILTVLWWRLWKAYSSWSYRCCGRKDCGRRKYWHTMQGLINLIWQLLKEDAFLRPDIWCFKFWSCIFKSVKMFV